MATTTDRIERVEKIPKNDLTNRVVLKFQKEKLKTIVDERVHVCVCMRVCASLQDRERKKQKSCEKYRCVYLYRHFIMWPVQQYSKVQNTLCVYVIPCVWVLYDRFGNVLAVYAHTHSYTAPHKYTQTHLLKYVWHMCLFSVCESNSNNIYICVCVYEYTQVCNVKTHSCHSRNYVFTFCCVL